MDVPIGVHEIPSEEYSQTPCVDVVALAEIAIPVNVFPSISEKNPDKIVSMLLAVPTVSLPGLSSLILKSVMAANTGSSLVLVTDVFRVISASETTAVASSVVVLYVIRVFASVVNDGAVESSTM